MFGKKEIVTPKLAENRGHIPGRREPPIAVTAHREAFWLAAERGNDFEQESGKRFAAGFLPTFLTGFDKPRKENEKTTTDKKENERCRRQETGKGR